MKTDKIKKSSKEHVPNVHVNDLVKHLKYREIPHKLTSRQTRFMRPNIALTIVVDFGATPASDQIGMRCWDVT